jgi:hypothetical protein
VSKCNRYLQSVHCTSIHLIQSHCSYPGCSGRAGQKPCSAHKSSSSLVRSSLFIDHIRSKVAPPPLPCSPDDVVGPSYAGAGSVIVVASVARIVGAVVVAFPFFGHCFDICPCARQLKHRRSLSSIFHSSLVRNAALLYCPRGCWAPLLAPAVSTASTSIASSLCHQLFPLPFKACSHLFLS